MTRSRRTVTILAAAGTLTIGGVIAAPIALAAANGTGPIGAGRPAGQEQMFYRDVSGAGTAARGGLGLGPGAGSCLTTGTAAPAGVLTDQQKADLQAMAEEEKLSHDLYTAFAVQYPAAVFDRVTAAETRHLDAVRALLTRYQVSDPTAGKAAGEFATPRVQAGYDRLLAQGSAGEDAALAVGQSAERTDIADLRTALAGLTAPDVQQVYQNLMAGSQHHLAAFTAWLNQ